MRNTEAVTITYEYLNKYKTPKGGYNRKQVEALGLSWPLVSGWKGELIGKVLTAEKANIFESAAKKPNKKQPKQSFKIDDCIEYLFKNTDKLTMQNIAKLRFVERKWRDVCGLTHKE
jgi:hypothetical protein